MKKLSAVDTKRQKVVYQPFVAQKWYFGIIEDPDKMLNNALFHQDLYCFKFAKDKIYLQRKKNNILKIITRDRVPTDSKTQFHDHDFSMIFHDQPRLLAAISPR